LGETLFCHATPRDEYEVLTRLTPERVLRPIFEDSAADVVVCGHTHMQFDRPFATSGVAGVRIVNAGSLGMPFGEPGAYWALLGPKVELKRTEYDLAQAAEQVLATDYPAATEFARDLQHPRSEDAMLELFSGVEIEQR
jgi:predicted phosphodiesterase